MDIKELNVNKEQRTNRNHPWEYARAEVVIDLLCKHIKGRKLKCVTDIGCGDVFFLNQFCSKFEVETPIAVDVAFDNSIISQLKQTNRNILFFKNIDDISALSPNADIIFLMDVLEHIENDVEFLKKLLGNGLVDKNTCFMITVPAFNKLYCSHDKWLGHYRRYDLRMLKQHIELAGLECIEGGYFFTSLLIPRWMQKKLESPKKMEKEQTGIGGWKRGKIVSKLYEWALLCDYYFFRFFRSFGLICPGLSTYILCKQQ